MTCLSMLLRYRLVLDVAREMLDDIRKEIEQDDFEELSNYWGE